MKKQTKEQLKRIRILKEEICRLKQYIDLRKEDIDCLIELKRANMNLILRMEKFRGYLIKKQKIKGDKINDNT